MKEVNTGKIKISKVPRGYFVVLVLVFAAVFFTLISALAGYIFVEKRAQLAKENKEKALHIAEAGLEYYKWFLAHYPDDLQNGTGEPGPYVHTLNDPEGGILGKFSLKVSGETICGVPTGVVIESTGWTASDPSIKRVVSAEYSRPSVASYSHIVDANVWAGSDRVINGPYHSNQGVRMDGTHNATVSSGVEDWLCTSSFGCDPDATQDGVFGAGSQPALWEFPVPPISFQSITVDLAQLKNFAQSDGVYIGPSRRYGYQVTFKDDRSIDVREVRGAIRVWTYTTEEEWHRERTVMSNVHNITNYPIPEDCPVVFIEDNVWLDGEVRGKNTLAVAKLPDTGDWKSVILSGDITYADSASGVTVIGQDDVLVGLVAPDVLDISGIFIAQNGKFGRNHYDESLLPGSLDEYVTRSILNTTGTVVSKGRVGTKWNSNGVFVSGYSQRNDSYDINLASDPPPFTPHTSDDYTFIDWREGPRDIVTSPLNGGDSGGQESGGSNGFFGPEDECDWDNPYEYCN